jgi:hypothetical protein
VSWSSSNINVATVSGGTVTAVAEGTATITVTSADGNKTANCPVTVRAATLTPSGLASYLATLPANTASSPHNITLKVTSTDEFTNIKTALNGASNKYVKLDLTGSTITTIPDYAFFNGSPSYIGCSTLIGITIPNSVTSIGNYAFRDCSRLASVTIPNSVTSIEYFAFKDCTSLATVIIPNSVTSIRDYVFSGCSSLTSVTFLGTIPSSGFGTYDVFPGDLRAKFYATNSANGTLGTYTRPSGGEIWTRQ